MNLQSLQAWQLEWRATWLHVRTAAYIPGNLPALHRLSREGTTVMLMSWEQTWEQTARSPTQPYNSLLWIKEDRH